METSIKTTASCLSDAIDIGLLDLDKAEFYITPGGFTGLKYGDEDYNRIMLRRALPIGQPMDYISVSDKENKEIGMIRSVSELSDSQRSIVIAELEKRYYCPVIHKVNSVKDKLGYVYFEFELGREEQSPEKNLSKTQKFGIFMPKTRKKDASQNSENLCPDGAEERVYMKTCAVKDVNRNIRMLDDERIIIFDVDGNRYIINSLSALDKKSLSMLEPYMF